MVVWKAGNEFEIFEKIAEDALNDACTVLILSQPSADSICAGLIIQARLQAVSRPRAHAPRLAGARPCRVGWRRAIRPAVCCVAVCV